MAARGCAVVAEGRAVQSCCEKQSGQEGVVALAIAE